MSRALLCKQWNFYRNPFSWRIYCF